MASILAKTSLRFLASKQFYPALSQLNGLHTSNKSKAGHHWHPTVEYMNRYPNKDLMIDQATWDALNEAGYENRVEDTYYGPCGGHESYFKEKIVKSTQLNFGPA